MFGNTDSFLPIVNDVSVLNIRKDPGAAAKARPSAGLLSQWQGEPAEKCLSVVAAF